MARKKTSGVYAILNWLNGKIYVGSSVDIEMRWYGHRSDLNKNRHHSQHLQRAWNLYGPDVFLWKVLEVCEPGVDPTEREQTFLDCYWDELAYNSCQEAKSRLGSTHSEATRLKLSLSHKGRKKSPQEIENRAKALRGQTRTEAFCEANANRQRRYSPEEAQQIRERYLSGENQKSLAAKWGCSQQSISRICRGSLRAYRTN